MSYTDYLASRGYPRVTVERTTLLGAPVGHRVIDRVDRPARRVEATR